MITFEIRCGRCGQDETLSGELVEIGRRAAAWCAHHLATVPHTLREHDAKVERTLELVEKMTSTEYPSIRAAREIERVVEARKAAVL